MKLSEYILFLRGYNKRQKNNLYMRSHFICWLINRPYKRAITPEDIMGAKDKSEKTLDKKSLIAKIKREKEMAEKIFNSEVKGNTELDKMFGG